jgi:hypothetical protein
MGFKENLSKKIEIDALAQRILHTIGPVESDRRIDKDLMARLLEMGGYSAMTERDLTLYLLDGDVEAGRFLVLDNDIAIYQTSAADIGLRKSPTVKEMLSIRNIKKILNDADVVLSKKEHSLKTIQNAIIDQLDLEFNTTDIDDLAQEGKQGLESRNANQANEILTLFSELLSYSSPPAPFRIKGFDIMGCASREDNGAIRFGPMVLFDPMNCILKYIDDSIYSHDKVKIERMHQIAWGESEASREGPDVFDILKTSVLQKKRNPEQH